MGQWSGRNRAQAEASRRSHKRPHISDSAAREAGGEEGGGESGGRIQRDEDLVGWCLAFGTCMRKREREREASLLSLTSCPPGVFCSVGPCKSYISPISFHLAPSPSSPC